MRISDCTVSLHFSSYLALDAILELHTLHVPACPQYVTDITNLMPRHQGYYNHNAIIIDLLETIKHLLWWYMLISTITAFGRMSLPIQKFPFNVTLFWGRDYVKFIGSKFMTHASHPFQQPFCWFCHHSPNLLLTHNFLPH